MPGTKWHQHMKGPADSCRGNPATQGIAWRAREGWGIKEHPAPEAAVGQVCHTWVLGCSACGCGRGRSGDSDSELLPDFTSAGFSSSPSTPERNIGKRCCIQQTLASGT